MTIVFFCFLCITFHLSQKTILVNCSIVSFLWIQQCVCILFLFILLPACSTGQSPDTHCRIQKTHSLEHRKYLFSQVTSSLASLSLYMKLSLRIVKKISTYKWVNEWNQDSVLVKLISVMQTTFTETPHISQSPVSVSRHTWHCHAVMSRMSRIVSSGANGVFSSATDSRGPGGECNKIVTRLSQDITRDHVWSVTMTKC